MPKRRTEGDGFAELLRYSHMVAPEVMGLKDGGYLAGFWLTGPDLESSTARELEHLSAMMARTVGQLDVRWCVHFEVFRRETRDYPSGNFRETTTRLIDQERYAQFHQAAGHFESVQAMFVSYVPPAFEKNALMRRIQKTMFGLDSAEECLQRIENRVAHGGHNIREEDVLRRFAGRWEAVAKVLPYCDEAHFFDNYNGFVEVAEYVNGELIVKGSRLPAWVEELREFLT